MRMNKKQINQRFKKRVNLKKSHLRWNHEIVDRTELGGQTGLYHFYVVGDKRVRKKALDFLASELIRIAEQPNQLNEFEGTVKGSKFRFSYVAWESCSDLNEINWHYLGMPVVKDKNLYTRVKEGTGRDLETYVRKNLSEEFS